MMVKQWRRTVLLAFALAVGAGWQALARLDPENADPAIPAGPRPEQVEWELPDHLHSFTEQKLALQTAASLARQWKEAGQKAGSADPAGKRAALFNDMGAWMAQLPNAPETEPLLAQAVSDSAAAKVSAVGMERMDRVGQWWNPPILRWNGLAAPAGKH